MTWLRPGLAALLIGAAAVGMGVYLPSVGWYATGLGVGGFGLAVLIMIVLRRLHTGRGPVRWLITVLVPLVLISAALAIPQRLIGRPDSAVRWQTSFVGAPDTGLVGGRLYLHSKYSDQILDPRTGQTLVSIPTAGYGLTVGADGSFVQRGKDIAVYRGPDGTKRWTIKSDGSPEVLAIADGWVVLRDCRGLNDVCGIRPDGTIDWLMKESKAYTWLGYVGWERQHTSASEVGFMAGQAGVEPAARVAVRLPDKKPAEVLTPSGRVITRLTERPLAVGGDLVVTLDSSDSGCRLSGIRGRDRVFRSRAVPCAGTIWSGSYLMLARRMYFMAGEQLESGWALDLGTGALRRTGALVTGSDSDDRDNPALEFPSDQVIVRRTGHLLTGLDPATGRRLWSYSAGGDRIPGVYVENGAVAVLSTLPDRAAALSGLDPQDSPKSITVLDAHSGKVTGRRLITGGPSDADGIWSSYGIGPGRELVMISRGDGYAIGTG